MIESSLQDHPGWQWCTAEGAELHTLLMGLQTSFREKIQWLEEAEELSLAFQANREKASKEPTSSN
jgi:hypothetical protein